MNRIIALISLVVLVGTLYINYLAGIGQINDIATGDVSGLYPTLFTPAGFTFAIWSIIYLLNTAFIASNLACAFRNPEAFQKRLVVLFILVCLANTGWIMAWHYDQMVVSVFLMLTILVLLILAFKESHQGKSKGFANGLAKINFGVYLGWISVATIANVSVTISGPGELSVGQSQMIWTLIVLAVAVALACWMLFRFKSFAYAMVIVWAFYGIYSARSAQSGEVMENLALAALVGLGLVLVTGGYVFTRKLISLRS